MNAETCRDFGCESEVNGKCWFAGMVRDQRKNEKFWTRDSWDGHKANLRHKAYLCYRKEELLEALETIEDPLFKDKN